MVTCAGTGKAPTCVLHHAKPWDYNKHARTGIHTCFAPFATSACWPPRIPQSPRHRHAVTKHGYVVRRHSIHQGRATPWQCVFHSFHRPDKRSGGNAPCSAWSRPWAWPCLPRLRPIAPTHRLPKAPSAKRAGSGSGCRRSAAAQTSRPSNATSGFTANARAGTTPEHAPDTPGSRRAGASADTLPETVLGRPRIPKNPAKPCHHWIFSHLCTPEFSPIHGTTPIF